MANRKISHGVGASAVSQNTVSQDTVCHASRRVEAACRRWRPDSSRTRHGPNQSRAHPGCPSSLLRYAAGSCGDTARRCADHRAPGPEIATCEVTAYSLHTVLAVPGCGAPAWLEASATEDPRQNLRHFRSAAQVLARFFLRELRGRVSNWSRRRRSRTACVRVFLRTPCPECPWNLLRRLHQTSHHRKIVKVDSGGHGKRLPKGKRIATGGNRMDGVQQVEVRDVGVVAATYLTLRCIVGKRFVAGKCRVEVMSGEEPL
jgi:hypothetical protein